MSEQITNINPRLELLPQPSNINHAQFQLIEDYVVRLSNGFELTIPKGYKTDLASVPRFLHSVMSPSKSGLRLAGLVHDYLYDNWRDLIHEGLPEAASRKWCDKEFLRLCKLNWRKYLMYFVLRVVPQAKKMYYD